MVWGGRHRLGEGALDRVGMSGGGRCRLGVSALRGESGLGEEDTDLERAHLIGWE